jgi:hypothetical protein
MVEVRTIFAHRDISILWLLHPPLSLNIAALILKTPCITRGFIFMLLLVSRYPEKIVTKMYLQL